MGLFRFIFGLPKRKYTVEDLRDLEQIFIDREQRKAKTSNNDFFGQMRQYNQLQKEMQEDKEREIQEIIEKYAPQSEGGSFEDDIAKMILPKLLSGGVKIPQTATPEQPQDLGGSMSEEELRVTAEIIKEKVPKSAIKHIKGIADGDLIKLKKS